MVETLVGKDVKLLIDLVALGLLRVLLSVDAPLVVSGRLNFLLNIFGVVVPCNTVFWVLFMVRHFDLVDPNLLVLGQLLALLLFVVLRCLNIERVVLSYICFLRVQGLLSAKVH